MLSTWQWSSSIELGNDAIDNQHKELIERVNALNRGVSHEEKGKIGLDTIDFLKQYIVRHFEDEEAIQEEVGFPGYAEHKKSHQEFIERFDSLLAEYSQQAITTEVYFELSRLLNEWIVEHIGAADRVLAQFIKSKEV